MRVEAPRLSEQPVLPSFPTVTSLPSKDKERPPHLSGDAEGKGPPMKKRKRFSLAWLALLALAGGLALTALAQAGEPPVFALTSADTFLASPLRHLPAEDASDSLGTRLKLVELDATQR